MVHDDSADALTVTVACSPRPGVAEETSLVVARGATLRDAIDASGVLVAHPHLDGHKVGVWGRVQPLDTLLREGDRVELYRPLEVDPKEARRRRQALQRAAATCSRRR